MRSKVSGIVLIGGLFLLLLFLHDGCKKQPRCGCGKDVIQTLVDLDVIVQYDTSASTILFYPVYTTGATYYFCNPGQWIDSLKKLNTKDYLLLTGKAYYDCNYIMQSSNYPYLPPVYQTEVTGLREDNYGK
ncbi:MAG: hypothetical protein ABR974_11195 [Bacteroidales bacterium]|jgi:hypothetical protein